MAVLVVALTACSEPGSSPGSSPITSPTDTPITENNPSSQPEEPATTEASPTPSISSQLAVWLLSPRAAAEQAGIDPDGAVAGVYFTDANGENTVVLRETQIVIDVATESGSVLADHVVRDGAGLRVLREVRDGVQECPWDLTAEFVPNSLAVTDYDRDGIGEVLFVYQLACRSDVSPREQKLLLLENGDKYILRGSTSTPDDPYEDPLPEPTAEHWPLDAYESALDRFQELAPDFR